MKLKKLTPKFFNDQGACYPAEKSLGDGWTGTILDLLKDESIPASNRIWAATRTGVLPEELLKSAAAAFLRETTLGDGRVVGDLVTSKKFAVALENEKSHIVGDNWWAILAARGVLSDSPAEAVAFAAAAAVASEKVGDVEKGEEWLKERELIRIKAQSEQVKTLINLIEK